jgi:hypothetical protein
MCGTHPMVYLFGFPTPRPFGLPSHSDRLNGVGLTGRRALDGLPVNFTPNGPHLRRYEVAQIDKPPDARGASVSL